MNMEGIKMDMNGLFQILKQGQGKDKLSPRAAPRTAQPALGAHIDL